MGSLSDKIAKIQQDKEAEIQKRLDTTGGLVRPKKPVKPVREFQVYSEDLYDLDFSVSDALKNLAKKLNIDVGLLVTHYHITYEFEYGYNECDENRRIEVRVEEPLELYVKRLENYAIEFKKYEEELEFYKEAKTKFSHLVEAKKKEMLANRAERQKNSERVKLQKEIEAMQRKLQNL